MASRATEKRDKWLRAILFDFDGVILESAAVKTLAFAELFDHLGTEQVEHILRYHNENVGISRYAKFEWIYANLLERELTENERDRLGRRFSEIVFQRVVESPFVPGAREALEELYDDYLLYVVSGTPESELQQIVTQRGLSDHFQEVYGSPRTKPEIVRGILQRNQLPPERALFIGDGPSDHRAAAETGLEFLARDTPEHHDFWVETGVRMAPDLRGLAQQVEQWGQAR